MCRIRLGVNVDHIATIRQQRGTRYPDPIYAAALAEEAGADQITIHLREDRRHIQERDLALLVETAQTRINLEMAATNEMLEIALKYKPHGVTLVPEKREERTTEGGLDVVKQLDFLKKYIAKLHENKIFVSLFIEATKEQVEACVTVEADAIELHTGHFADATTEQEQYEQLEKLMEAGEIGHHAGLAIIAGHGLDYVNCRNILQIPHLEEVNIGHSIIARSMFTGLKQAIWDMIELLQSA